MASDVSKRSLTSKLAEVMAAVERIPKNGHNDFFNYDFATEADIVAAVRQELASRHIMLIPAIVGREREPVGEKGSVLTHLDMTFTFYDGESGEEKTFSWLGVGSDKDDKGAYKAMTGGEKYFLLKTFLIPTGDDPEADAERPVAVGESRNTASRATRLGSPQLAGPRTVMPQKQRPAVLDPPRQRAQASGNGADLLISEKQAGRFHGIARDAKWPLSELKLWLKEVWGLDSSKDIPRQKYEAICAAVAQGVPPV
jgi:hypothetical protein